MADTDNSVKIERRYRWVITTLISLLIGVGVFFVARQTLFVDVAANTNRIEKSMIYQDQMRKDIEEIKESQKEQVRKSDAIYEAVIELRIEANK